MTKGLANLRRLSLRDNQLQSIPSQLAPWSQLDMVDLSGNPFNCECDILWLRSALLSDVVCASPLAVSNRTLHTLSDDQLGCPTALNSNSVLIAVSATGGVLLFILTLTFLLWRFRQNLWFLGIYCLTMANAWRGASRPLLGISFSTYLFNKVNSIR